MSQLSIRLAAVPQRGEEPLLAYKDRWYTASAFWQDVTQVRQWLATAGVGRGHRVVLALPNSYAFAVIYVAILCHGATVVPINPAMPVPELDRVVPRAEPKAAFIHPGMQAYFLAHEDLRQLQSVFVLADAGACPLTGTRRMRADGAWTEAVWADGGEAGAGTRAIAAAPGVAAPVAEEADAAARDGNHPDEEDVAILLFTSGTTGLPKGVALTHRQVMATARNVIASHRLTPADVSYVFLPLFHINAQVVALLSTLLSGGRMVIEEKFSKSRFWDTVARYQVTWASAVPTVIGILVKATDPPRVPASLRFLRSASAPLPAFVARRFEAKFGIPIIESYGLTEAASQVCVNPLPPGKRKIGSVGLPCGVELRVVDGNDRELPPGEIGEIVIRGESVVTSYAYGDAGPETFRGGWFHTGDMGYVDEEGYVYITGRTKEMINRAGQKVSPREVEEVIAQHPAVKQVAVIGLPDELYGEKVLAYVVPEEGMVNDEAAFKEALRQLCQSSLSSYKCPADFHLVDDIPVGPTGKVQRHRLREQVLVAQGQPH